MRSSDPERPPLVECFELPEQLLVGGRALSWVVPIPLRETPRLRPGKIFQSNTEAAAYTTGSPGYRSYGSTVYGSLAKAGLDGLDLDGLIDGLICIIY